MRADGEGSGRCCIPRTEPMLRDLSVEASSLMVLSFVAPEVRLGQQSDHRGDPNTIPGAPESSRLPPAASRGRSWRLLEENSGTLEGEEGLMNPCWFEMEGTTRGGICVGWRS